ncbi:SusD/RagB family nutrient-binding outer membrane lipoprotein [Spirosoma sp. KCTC 42546]|uniref:SusD/RagB family nutrient-binding outer membrane lipoprotein n=1 Tax=Spirosoma sp. KCTC 42546 TaxID=2520506 RepID=UPI0011593662|nr:SusD/RagB family nutrient-binding outer membrane lipoprotein [Spirosoma sp. KCTC 42546]QDK79288.1 SusD/RagB family nutrient-binding outer membrane lipoprotein [Spirosoma sp. KCTC 42546]
MKNRFYKFTYCLLALCTLQSCDKGLEELNINPDASSTVSPDFVFTKAQYDAVGNMITGLQGTMQYTTSYNDVASWGSKYIFNQGTAPYTVFTNAYPNEINEIGEVIRALEKDPAQVNKLAIAKIWRAYSFSKITDLYGDIPYKQAAQGYTQSIFKPVYDPQKDIYADLLSELEKAIALFDATKSTFGAADLMYGGDIAKWKKFAYSLMLRMGMRMTKPDVALAETWVKKAIAGSLITEDGDMAKIVYLSSGQVVNQNPLAYWMLNSDYLKADGVSNPEGGKYYDTFINYLKKTNDPRLPVLSVVYVNGKPSTDVSLQKGMAATIPNTKPADFVTYSEPNQNTILKLNAPMLVLTNAEVNFYLAEAAIRGWYTAKTPAALYDLGVKAAMRQWALYGADGVISQANIDAYATANALVTTATQAQQLEQLYTQFWVSIFPNSQEVFLNWRRTGYPALVPNNYTGNITGGKIFRRMLYPATEENLNKENYLGAVARQGENTFLTQMWLDK